MVFRTNRCLVVVPIPAICFHLSRILPWHWAIAPFFPCTGEPVRHFTLVRSLLRTPLWSACCQGFSFLCPGPILYLGVSLVSIRPHSDDFFLRGRFLPLQPSRLLCALSTPLPALPGTLELAPLVWDIHFPTYREAGIYNCPCVLVIRWAGIYLSMFFGTVWRFIAQSYKVNLLILIFCLIL